MLPIHLQFVVEKAVLLVPQACAAERIHRVADTDEVFEEFRSHVFVDGIVLRELDRNRQHRQAVESHPCGAVGLLQKSARRQRLGTIEHTDVVEPEESAGKEIISFGVFAVHPPGKVEHQFLERTFEKREVALAARSGHFVNAPHCPGVDRWVDVSKRELVGRNLAVRVHVPFAQEKIELLFGEMRIDLREWDHVECEVPRRKPRIFPLVRHRNDVAIKKMLPFGVASEMSLRWWRRLRRITRQPFANHVVVELFAPKQTGISLTSDIFRLLVGFWRRDRIVKFVRLLDALREHGIKLAE